MTPRIASIIGHCAPTFVYRSHSFSTATRLAAKQSRTPFKLTSTAPQVTIDSLQACLRAQYTVIMEEMEKKTTQLTAGFKDQQKQKFAKVLKEIKNKDKAAAGNMKLMREIVALKEHNQQLIVRRQRLSLTLGYLRFK